MLTFGQENRKVYRVGEEVQLKLVMKNVRVVTVKIFGVDMEKQYLEGRGSVD